MEGYEYQSKGNKHSPITNPESMDNVGVVPRIIYDMFNEARNKSNEKHITLFCSFL